MLECDFLHETGVTMKKLKKEKQNNKNRATNQAKESSQNNPRPKKIANIHLQ